MTDAARIFEDLHRPTRLKGEEHRAVETYVAVGRPGWDVECAARAGMVAAAADLAVKRRPQLLFFAETSQARAAVAEDLGGLVFKHPAVRGLAHLGHHAVAVDADLSPEEAAETAAHETFHVAAGRLGGEADAVAYGRKIRDALEPVMAFITQRLEPRVHELDFAPAHDNVLAHVAEPGDILRAPTGRSVLPRAYVNVGSKACPCWRRVS